MKFKNSILLFHTILLLQACTSMKVIDKQSENGNSVAGHWQLVNLNDVPINKSIVLPTMQIDLNQMQVSGNGGCNTYSGSIEKLSNISIIFSTIASTMKACYNKNIESDYFKVLNQVETYKIENNNLLLYGKEGENSARFLKQENKQANLRLHDIWKTTHINENLIDVKEARPQLEINLIEMKVHGTDSCNSFSAALNEVSNETIIFGALASTRKNCSEMTVANNFNKAMSMVSSYKLDGLNLSLLDRKGKVVLAFLKGD